MSLRWIEGFELFAYTPAVSNPAFKDKYQGSILVYGGVGHRFGNCARLGGGELRPRAFSSNNTWVVGVDMKFDHTGMVGGTKLILADGANEQCRIELEVSGSGWVAKFYRGATEVEATSRVMNVDQWYYLEFKATVHPSSGSYELRIDGETLLSGSGNTADQGTAGADEVALQGSGWMDHIYILDGDGDMNSFLGPQVVEGVFPNADGDVTDFSLGGSGTAHYDRVNEEPQPDDTDYTYSDNAGDEDLFEFENLDKTGDEINGVALVLAVLLAAADSRTFKGRYRTPGGDGYSFALDTIDWDSLREVLQIKDENPDTGLPWYKDDVDDGQFGVELES
jgi:hypothetical protein